MDLNIREATNPEILNLAEYIDQGVLDEIGIAICKGVDLDEDSRSDWLKENESWLKLATQYKETKSFPWPGAANIKYPLVQTAAMQFSARAYPALVPNKKPVKTAIVGKEDEAVNEEAKKISDHMSYQIMYEMENWEEEMDKLTVVLPVSGVAFKKIYRDHTKDTNVSQLVMPRDVVVNYWAKSIDTAARITHILELNPNEVEIRKRQEVFLDVEFDEPSLDQDKNTKVSTTLQKKPSEVDYTTPLVFYECHTWWDLDEDGLQEPYVITVEKNSKKVARITPRFHEEGIEWDENDEIVKINPIQYWTKFGFIPSPDGGFYDMGFGLLLGPLNETINTSLNQLLDAGTLSTLQAGFLGKGIRIRGGEYRTAPNEWKVVNANVDDLRKHIFPLPVKEPSSVLFQLLGTLVQSGKELASIAEIFTGKMPGQNTPATTTKETIKQGMAVFTAIYKRIYRSLDKEFKALFQLNKLYMDDIIDYPVDLTKETYLTAHLTVKPVADPDAASDAEKLVLAQAYMELADKGRVNPQVATKKLLEALRSDDIEALMNFQPPKSPEETKLEMEQMAKQNDAALKKAVAEHKASLEAEKAAREQALAQQEMKFKEEQHQQQMRHEREMGELKLAIETRMGEIKLAIADMTRMMKEAQEKQSLELDRQKGEEAVRLAKEKKAATNNSKE